jgi:hypothetical protein
MGANSFALRAAAATLRPMKRDIEWVEKLEDGVTRTVRICFYQKKIKWQFKRSDQALWDHATPPSADDWAALEAKVERLYQRRRVSYEDLDLVRTTRKTLAAELSPRPSGPEIPPASPAQP